MVNFYFIFRVRAKKGRFLFPEIFLLRKYMNFFNVKAERFHFLKCKEYFPVFFCVCVCVCKLGLKSPPVSYFCKIFHCRYLKVLNMSQVLNVFLVLNMPGFWIYLSQNIRKFHFLKIRKVFLRKYKELFQSKFFIGKYIKKCFG